MCGVFRIVIVFVCKCMCGIVCGVYKQLFPNSVLCDPNNP